MKYQKKIALCAIVCAMNVLVLLIGSVIDVLDLTACGITAFLVALIAIEVRGYYPWLVWGVTAALSLFLLPSKFPGVLFVLLGFYPILKLYLEKLPRVVGWIIKLCYFNGVLTLMITATKLFLMMPDGEIDFTGIVYLIGNAAFVFFDFCLTYLLGFYRSVLRRHPGLGQLFRH